MAVKGKVLGRKRLRSIATLFSPDTILRWHRKLVAKKWDYSSPRNKMVQPAISKEVEGLVLKFARENPSWGYDRIADALKNLDHVVTDQTVGNILKQHGVEPAPDRETRTYWKTVLHAHWDSIAAKDFTTVEVWTPKELVTYYLLFVLDWKSGRKRRSSTLRLRSTNRTE